MILKDLLHLTFKKGVYNMKDYSMKEYQYKRNLTSTKAKCRINYFYYIKQIFITALFMIGLYCFVVIGFILDTVVNH